MSEIPSTYATSLGGVSMGAEGHVTDRFRVSWGLIPSRQRGVQRVGEGLSYGIAESPYGRVMVVERVEGLCSLMFIDEIAAGLSRHEDLMKQAWPISNGERNDLRAATWASRIFHQSPLQDEVGELLNVCVQGTAFQLRVWQTLIRVPKGAVVSYGQLACDIGQPQASRAVGGAVGANPLAYLIPCHRVLPAHGGVGGYRWGEARKRMILDDEGVSVSAL